MWRLPAYPFARLWVDSPHEVNTELTAREAHDRLDGKRYEDGTMIVLIRRRLRSPTGYAMIAIRRGKSSGLQRFFYAELEPAPAGMVLRGVIRTRRPAKWFVTTGLCVFSFILVFTVPAAGLELVLGHTRSAGNDAQFSAFIGLLDAGYLGLTNLAMSSTAANEKYLLTWLAERLK